MVRSKIILAGTVIMLFASSSIVFAIPYLQENNNKMISICAGAVFWGFLILAFAFFYLFPLKTGQEKAEIKKKSKWFYPNKPALFFNLLFVLSVFVNVLMFFVRPPLWQQAVALFALLFSFEMHFIFHSNRYEVLYQDSKNKNTGDGCTK